MRHRRSHHHVPCALALAVPAVQVAATSRLFAKGIIVKAADGLERLAEVDTVVFDKTGTLTRGEPGLKNADDIDATTLARAAALALASRHPYALAVVKAARERGLQVRPESGVTEIPGSGLTATDQAGHEQRLGSVAWVLGESVRPQGGDTATLWYAETGSAPVGFEFDDAPRSDAGTVVSVLRNAGFGIELLSGDREHAVRKAARAVGIDRWFAGVRPDGKIARIAALGGERRRVLMVGDGLNDAPALATAHASLSPSSAADISQNAADAVFQGEKLEPVLEALGVAQASQRMAVQNFAIAIAYNIVSVPLAMAGHVTPLIAALAMSLSSIAVTGNALRLRNCKVALARVDRSSSGETP
jgi:Cu2+-exporting ATPase